MARIYWVRSDSENGVMTLDDWLDTYVRHILDHIAQMQANYAEWARRISSA